MSTRDPTASTAADFADKIVLVTGTSGIGRAIAMRMARGGATVVALGIDAASNDALAAEAAAPGLRLTTHRTDVAEPAEVGAAIEAVVERHGGLDVIVNAAAIHPYGDAVSTTPETFLECLKVNVGSIHLTAHFGVPALRRRGGGVIVNLASVQGFSCQAGVTAYVASKGAIHALTRAMALDHARENIRVVSISPASVRTPILALAARMFDGPDANIDDCSSVSARPTRSDGSPNRRRWPSWPRSWPPTRPASSRARTTGSTAH